LFGWLVGCLVVWLFGCGETVDIATITLWIILYPIQSLHCIIIQVAVAVVSIYENENKIKSQLLSLLLFISNRNATKRYPYLTNKQTNCLLTYLLTTNLLTNNNIYESPSITKKFSFYFDFMFVMVLFFFVLFILFVFWFDSVRFGLVWCLLSEDFEKLFLIIESNQIKSNQIESITLLCRRSHQLFFHSKGFSPSFLRSFIRSFGYFSDRTNEWTLTNDREREREIERRLFFYSSSSLLFHFFLIIIIM
jgi:hypothetical protein